MNLLIDGELEPALWFLGDWSVRWVLVVGLAAAFLILVRPRRAAMRHLIYWMALAAGLMVSITPRWQVAAPLFGLEREAVVEGPSFSPPALISYPVSHESPLKNATSSTPVGGLPNMEETSTPSPPPVSAPTLGKKRWLILTLAGAWGIGVACLILRAAVGAWYLRRLRKTAAAVQERSAFVLEECAREMPTWRPVRLLVHPEVRSPFLSGLLRPTILAPEDWEKLPESVQRGGLWHELAHVQRRDDWSGLVLAGVRIVFFFHPPVRWLLTRLEREREMLCDEAVLERGVPVRDYIRMLLQFACHSGRLGSALGVGSALQVTRRPTVKHRINYLLEETMNLPKSSRLSTRATAVAGAALAALLAAASFRLTVASPVAPGPQGKQDAPAVDPPKADQKKGESGDTEALVKPYQLRFDGKNFEQWQAILENELKPERRVEAIKAMSAFGQNGLGKEAAAAIMDVAKNYDVYPGDPEDTKVVIFAEYAFRKIGHESDQVILDQLKSGKARGKLFALRLLERGELPPGGQEGLIQAAKDRNRSVRIKALEVVFLRGEPDLRARRLQEAASDPDDLIRARAMNWLTEYNVFNEGNFREFLPAIKALLSDKDRSVRESARVQLEEIKTKYIKSHPNWIQKIQNADVKGKDAALDFLEFLGPGAKDAVPFLIDYLKTADRGHRLHAVRLLGGLGSAAQRALPVLSDLLIDTDTDFEREAMAAIRKITPKVEKSK